VRLQKRLRNRKRGAALAVSQRSIHFMRSALKLRAPQVRSRYSRR
jgi:hypothetical protein